MCFSPSEEQEIFIDICTADASTPIFYIYSNGEANKGKQWLIWKKRGSLHENYYFFLHVVSYCEIKSTSLTASFSNHSRQKKKKQTLENLRQITKKKT